MSTPRIYIAGPTSNLPYLNYPAFNAEAARLRALGYRVENPAENQALQPKADCWMCEGAGVFHGEQCGVCMELRA